MFYWFRSNLEVPCSQIPVVDLSLFPPRFAKRTLDTEQAIEETQQLKADTIDGKLEEVKADKKNLDLAHEIEHLLDALKDLDSEK